jgi:hypothetical protein
LIYRFSSHLLAFAVFLLLDDIIEFFLGFWSSTCASWGFGFELQTLCFFLSIDSSRGEIEKSSGQFLGLIVMSHGLGEV